MPNIPLKQFERAVGESYGSLHTASLTLQKAIIYLPHLTYSILLKQCDVGKSNTSVHTAPVIHEAEVSQMKITADKTIDILK